MIRGFKLVTREFELVFFQGVAKGSIRNKWVKVSTLTRIPKIPLALT